MTFDEADGLISAAEPEWRAMMTVATRTGLRIDELLALRWRDVDLEAGRLVVRRSASCGEVSTPKNGRMREVPSDEARAALIEQRHERGRAGLL